MSKMKRSVTMDKIVRFCKKQGYYILLAVCVIMVATIITLSVVLSQNSDVPTAVVPNDPDDGSDVGGGTPTPEPEKKYFTLPMQNEYQVYNGQIIGEKFQSLCYGLMFEAKAGDKVLSSGEGKVVSNDLAKHVLTVNYPEKNITILYKGLSYKSGVAKDLKAGSIIKKDQILGEASGVYNYNANYLSAVHVDILDTATNKRVSSYDKIFDIIDK